VVLCVQRVESVQVAVVESGAPRSGSVRKARSLHQVRYVAYMRCVGSAAQACSVKVQVCKVLHP